MDKAYFVLTFLAEIQQLSYLLFQQRGIPICCCMLKDAGDYVLYLKQSGRRQRVDLWVCDSCALREGASRLCSAVGSQVNSCAADLAFHRPQQGILTLQRVHTSHNV